MQGIRHKNSIHARAKNKILGLVRHYPSKTKQQLLADMELDRDMAMKRLQTCEQALRLMMFVEDKPTGGVKVDTKWSGAFM